MPKFLLPLALAFALSGCDTLNQAQYRIAAGASSPADRERVRGVLQTVARQTGLEERTATSRVPDTLAYYVDPRAEAELAAGTGAFRVGLGARAVGADLIVDLDADFGPPADKFTAARKLLAPALVQAFGPRVSEVPHDRSIDLDRVPTPAPPSNP